MNRTRKTLPCVVVALLCLAIMPPAGAENGRLLLKQIVGGLANPIFVCSPPGDNDRLFIIEENAARIRIYNKATSTLQPAGSAFLTLPFGDFTSGGEKGLLGLAFHPSYATNGYFYIYVSTLLETGESGFDHWTEVRRYKVDAGNPDAADLSSKTVVLRYQQPQPNHNAGWIGFDPTAIGAEQFYLHIASGDGGGGNDNNAGHDAAVGNGQSLNTLLGKMLRVDTGSNGEADDFPANPLQNYSIPPTNPFVGVAGRDEIWAYGLRNPWRCSFDRETGDLYIADVGQGAHEEVSVQPASSPGGVNYGWRLREGLSPNPTGSLAGPVPDPNGEPILDYPRTEGAGIPVVNGKRYGQSVTGGYVYRGPKMPWLRGTYFYADYKFEKAWSLRYDTTAGSIIPGSHVDRTLEFGLPDDDDTSTNQLASFGEDNEGNLYLLRRNGGSNGILFEIMDDWIFWRESEFSAGDQDDPAVVGPDANPDGDAMHNLFEFVTGRDPNLPDGTLPMVFDQKADGGADLFLNLSLSLDFDPADSVIKIFGESGSDLTDFSNGSALEVDNGDPLLFEVRDSVPIAPGSSRFLRINIDLP